MPRRPKGFYTDDKGRKRPITKSRRRKQMLFYEDFAEVYPQREAIDKYIQSLPDFSKIRIETEHGYITGAVIFDEFRAEDMVIKESQRRKGHGTRLWSDLEHALKKRGVKRIQGQATEDSWPYWRDKHGFKERYRETVYFQGRDVPGVIMYKDL